jgi:hypothetical protein
MAIIYTYPYDIDIQDLDAWVGTNKSDRKTKQFTALAMAQYLNSHGKISVAGQMTYRFAQSPGITQGTIALPGSGGDGASFSSITSLVIANNDLAPQYVVGFLDYLVGAQILISEQKDIDNFGHYQITSYTLNANPQYHTINLSLVGSNGNINVDDFYDIAAFTLSTGGDKSYVFTQNTPEITWSVAHNLNKFPSCTMVLSTGQQGYGDVTFIDENNLTITFAGAETGKAYLN